ncbi:Bcr/CflA family multidrug efflux MFS transporter [Gelidibacter gilvus]|uniref:Bcr/CflA family multidrug efflux MFS transporter n=1 Tax=Gelidibacter gilvus TaxID=59602 RepID=A0A4Q0XND7_9FLAO|nr:Bcr/CflA family multidrug efflux MFS transporter [Gelidibacter gilvus]RXJ52761.1 Bcr/CflA family multidrug efflux MFS transporter [Gelidibacter gilvus]
MQKKKRNLIILILGLLSALGPFSIDLYLPGFPEIARDLNSTTGRVALSLSSYFVGVSLGQMIYGPLLDRFGRRTPLLVGLFIYLFASVYIVYVTSVDSLILARFIQALGGCAGMVAARALVRDLFPVSETAKIFSLLMLVIAVSPIIAPTLGGFATAQWGWHSIFIILAVLVTLNILLVYFWLPLGAPPDTTMSLKPKSIITKFWNVFKTPQFYTYTLTGSFAASGLYAYIAGSPHVFMELYGVSEKQYGWIFGIIAMGLVTASQVNTYMLKKYTSQQIVKVTLLCQVVAGALLFLGTIFHLIEMYSMIVLVFLFLSTQGFAFPNTSALSLAPFEKSAGTASALMGALQLGIGAIITALVSTLSNETPLPMTGIMFFCASVSVMILYWGNRKMKTLEQVSIS